MTKYLKITYSVIVSIYCTFALLTLVFKNLEIPGISDAPFYVFLVCMAPFLFIGLISRRMQEKSIETKIVTVSDPETGEILEEKVALKNPDLAGIKYSKNDWIYAAISFLKVPLILVAVFGGIFGIMYCVILLIAHLTKH